VSFPAGVEFCASAEFAAANTTNVKAITRRFFRFIRLPFMYGETELSANAAQFQQQVLQQARFQTSSTIPSQVA
jgi:hypothetical protein